MAALVGFALAKFGEKVGQHDSPEVGDQMVPAARVGGALGAIPLCAGNVIRRGSFARPPALGSEAKGQEDMPSLAGAASSASQNILLAYLNAYICLWRG